MTVLKSSRHSGIARAIESVRGKPSGGCTLRSEPRRCIYHLDAKRERRSGEARTLRTGAPRGPAGARGGAPARRRLSCVDG
eukprot:490738-Prymnesium_polylepis.1